jgi:hypothetical protein
MYLVDLALNFIPIVFMIGLIPLVPNDYVLTCAYLLIIAVAMSVRREKNELKILALGFFIMILSEYLFIRTGVETFNRNSLLGLMPLWLPCLWAYGFVAIKRAVLILNKR